MQDKLTDEEIEAYDHNVQAAAREIELQHIGNPIGIVASAYLAGVERIEELEAEVKRLEAALKKYGMHTLACWEEVDTSSGECVCGLNEVRAAL